MAQVVIPAEVGQLVNVVAERWGYYLGKRTIQSELMKATTIERAKVRAVGQMISAKMNEYLNSGTDVRQEVAELQSQLAEARTTFKAKATPFYEKIKPLNKVLTFLDKTVIPQAIEQATHEKLTPRFQVSDYVLKALAPKPRKKK